MVKNQMHLIREEAMQLGKMKVTRREGGVITVQEILVDEEGCFISKPGSDRIEGRYLHELATAVADASPKVDALVRATANYLRAVDNGNTSQSMGCLANLRTALAQCGQMEA